MTKLFYHVYLYQERRQVLNIAYLFENQRNCH